MIASSDPMPAPERLPQWPITPSTIVRTDGVERRVNSRALKYWQQLAGARPFPARADITQETAGDLWGHIFVVAPASDPVQFRFVQVGAVLCDALGRDPTDRTVVEALPGAMGTRTLFFMQAAAGLKAPVTDDVGQWSREDGTPILYRSILLPLSDDGNIVNWLLGAFSFRRTV